MDWKGVAGELTEEVGNMKLLEDVVSASVATAKAGRLRLHEEDGHIYEARCQTHSLFIMPFGAGKRAMIVGNVAEAVGLEHCVRLTDFTEPGILGTVTRDRQYEDGAAVRAAMKGLLLCDEVQRLSRRARDALLALLEDQEYGRGLGFMVPYPIHKDGDGFSVHVEGGVINVHARFSSVFAGLYLSRKRLTDLALLSRFIPIVLQVECRDIYDLVRGRRKLNVKARPAPVGDIEFPNYLRFVDRHERVAEKLPFKAEPGFYGRNVLDVARLAASFAIRTGSAEVEDEHYERALNFVPLTLHNCVASTLTLTEYRVLSLFYAHPGIRQGEVASKLGLSDRQIRACVSRLKQVGLLWGGHQL
ncbi:MAG: winged helix-turn-helix transcriptional regulator [Desulfitobacteriaceae bacterium]|nr:winged helix-turn-helix transcriptional regulator [Desulfitobacteriaceae bacterium]